MKCFKHHDHDAIAVCTYCGRSLCPDCIPFPNAARITCSAACTTALEHGVKSLQTLLDKSAQNARASALYCYLCAGLSVAAAVAAWYMLPSPFLVYFTGGCALVLTAAGYGYGRAARKQRPDT